MDGGRRRVDFFDDTPPLILLVLCLRVYSLYKWETIILKCYTHESLFLGFYAVMFEFDWDIIIGICISGSSL